LKQRIDFRELILFEDENYVAINKPPFVSTLADRNDPVNLLVLAKNYTPDAQACHRLDKDTSGVLVFAKNPSAYRNLSMQFEKRSVEKIYHAVVDGVHHFRNQLVDAPILKTDDGLVKISMKEGKPAQTSFTTLSIYRDHSLVECRPVTGRMHQIRIHLSVLNASITGDETYGGKHFYLSGVKRGYNLKKFTDEQPLMKRMALHSESLAFASPSGEPLKVNAPYPKDFKALVRQLEHNR
jgi:RluA family pseudouridine synthase